MKIPTPIEPIKDKPLFIIGTGPSLAECDVSKLKNCYTMSFNRTFISYEEWGFEPTYYVGLDTVVNEDNKEKIIELIKESSIRQFFFSKSNTSVENFQSLKTTIVDYIDDPQHPNLDFYGKLHVGNSGLFGLQIAIAFLGFKEIYLLGCDANYTDKVEKIEIKTNGEYYSTGNEDVNHFRKDYYGKGTTYNKPSSEIYHYPAWKAFYDEYIKNKNNGLKIFNCSRNGKLQFFPYCDFKTITQSNNLTKYETSKINIDNFEITGDYLQKKINWLFMQNYKKENLINILIKENQDLLEEKKVLDINFNLSKAEYQQREMFLHEKINIKKTKIKEQKLVIKKLTKKVKDIEIEYNKLIDKVRKITNTKGYKLLEKFRKIVRFFLYFFTVNNH